MITFSFRFGKGRVWCVCPDRFGLEDERYVDRKAEFSRSTLLR